MSKAGKTDARKGQGSGARGGGSLKSVDGVSASTPGSKATTPTLTPQGAHNSHPGQEGTPGAASRRLSARPAAARGPQAGARSTRTPTTRESRGGAGAKPTSTGRTKYSCATSPSRTTFGDYLNAARPGLGGFNTSDGDAQMTFSAPPSVAYGSTGTADVFTSNPYSPLNNAPEAVPTSRRSRRDCTEHPALTTAAAANASVASAAKRGRTRSGLTRSSSASRSPSPSSKREKFSKVNEGVSKLEPLSQPKTRAQRANAAATDEVVRKPAVVPAVAALSPEDTVESESESSKSESDESESEDTAEPRRRGRNQGAAAVATGISSDAAVDPGPRRSGRNHAAAAAAVATGISSDAAVDPGPRRSGRNQGAAAAAARITRDAIAVAALRGNAATTVAPHITRATLLRSGQVVREMADAMMTARDVKRPSTPVPAAAEVATQRAADDARNTEADRFLAASVKKYTDGPPVPYSTAVKDILAEYQVVVDEWNAEMVQATPKPEALKKTDLTPREKAGIARMDPRWRGVARAHLEYGVPPPHSFPFQQWAFLDDAWTAVAMDNRTMRTLREFGHFAGVLITDAQFSRTKSGKFVLSVANPLFCFTTRDVLPCTDWRVFEGVEFGPWSHKIDRMKSRSNSNAVHDGILGPYITKSSNGADCPHYTLESVTAFPRATTHFYPNRSRSGDSVDGKKRLPKTWLGVSRRAVLLGLAATPAFEDGELAGDGSISEAGDIQIAHCDVRPRELDFLIELKGQQLRRDGTTGKLRYGGFPFAAAGKIGIACTEAALTAAGHHAVGSSVRRSATVRFQELIGSLPPRDSICARAYPYKLHHMEDVNHISISQQKSPERVWDVFEMAKWRVVDGLTTEQICERLREEREQPALPTSKVKSMLLTAVGDFDYTRPGVGVWPSPLHKKSGAGSSLSHLVTTIRALNQNTLKPVRDEGEAAIAQYKKIFGAALERDCFLIDWDTLTAIVPISMVDTAVDKISYTQEEQTDQVAYTSRPHPYPPCVAPPAGVLLDALRKRSPPVVLSATMELLGDGSEWKRRDLAGHHRHRSKSEFLHVATGYTTIMIHEAITYEANLVSFRAAGIVCGKNPSTGKPLFTHADRWSTRDSQRPVNSAINKLARLQKESP